MRLVGLRHDLIVRLVDVGSVAFFFENEDLVSCVRLLSGVDVNVETKAIKSDSAPPVRMIMNDGHRVNPITEIFDQCGVGFVVQVRTWSHDDAGVLEIRWLCELVAALKAICYDNSWHNIWGRIDQVTPEFQKPTKVNVN